MSSTARLTISRDTGANFAICGDLKEQKFSRDNCESKKQRNGRFVNGNNEIPVGITDVIT